MISQTVRWLGIFLLLTLSGCNNDQDSNQEARQKMAENYGVKIEDYPYPSSFPISYFVNNLQPGDTIEKVHDLIKGYEIVYHCDKYAEFYYFFSSDSSTALRFLVLYDENIQYKKIISEDDNSRDLDQIGCVADGLINNN